MTVISQQVLVEAVRCVERMPFKERERLADEIYLRQPHLLASVLVLHQFGIALAQMEVVINLLMVCHEAMKRSGKTWPQITEDDQDLCMARLLARMQFSAGLTEQQQAQATADAVADHPEQQLLAYAYGTLKEQGWLRIESEAHKMLVLCALNLVECVAYTAQKAPSRRPRR